MNKVGIALQQLHAAENRLAGAFRTFGSREAADQEVYYVCHDLAEQCDAHAHAVRRAARRYGKRIMPPLRVGPVERAASQARRNLSYLIGRSPVSGLLLLRDLRRLFVLAQTVNLHWILASQIAQVARDHELLDEVSALHKETATQIKWLKTRLRQTSPQVLLASDARARTGNIQRSS